MNELSNVLRTVNAAMRTVKVIDAAKKVTVVAAAAMCCVFAYRFFKKG